MADICEFCYYEGVEKDAYEQSEAHGHLLDAVCPEHKFSVTALRARVTELEAVLRDSNQYLSEAPARIAELEDGLRRVLDNTGGDADEMAARSHARFLLGNP